MAKKFIIGSVVVGVAIAALVIWQTWPPAGGASTSSDGSTTIAAVSVPSGLSASAQLGQQIFSQKCQTCHGENAAGHRGMGPPLIHKIYQPSHHADESVQRAVALGVRAHHWPFGNMLPVAGLSRDHVSLIITYLREMQRANGIY